MSGGMEGGAPAAAAPATRPRQPQGPPPLSPRAPRRPPPPPPAPRLPAGGAGPPPPAPAAAVVHPPLHDSRHSDLRGLVGCPDGTGCGAYAAYSRENNRGGINSIVSERALREVFT